jgi:tyrosyl-tRNA synthetase
MTFLDPKEQLKILKRGIVHIEIEDELIKKLQKSRDTNTPLRIKAGFDPTAPDLHLGHVVLLTKMRQFQDLGHQVIFLIGDFTARIGDPSGKNTTRPPLDEAAINKNAATYKEQVFKVLDEKKTLVEFNSKWLLDFSFDQVIKLASKYSLARMIEREDFKNRLENQKPISMHELLYPLIQGYDSVALKADIELGGSDQLFNLLVGRNLMRQFGQEPQCIMTVPLLEGIEAKEENGVIIGDKMSKSLNNYISVQEDYNNQFGKIMSISDALMWRYFELLSLKTTDEINNLKNTHPKDAKIALAMEIVERFNSLELAKNAKEQFESLFGQGKRSEIPQDAPTFTFKCLDNNTYPLLLALQNSQLSESNADSKRLIKQGGLIINAQKIDDPQHTLSAGNYTVRAGKKRWATIIITP